MTLLPPNVEISYTNVFKFNITLHFQTHLVILKAVKEESNLQLLWKTSISSSFHLFSNDLLFLLSISNIITFHLSLLEFWHLHSHTHVFSHWVPQPQKLSPSSFSLFPCFCHCIASSLLGLEAIPSISLSPLSALLHTVAGVGFLESKSVIVILLFQHLSWLPIAWRLSPDTSGLSFVQTDVSGQL